MAGLVNLVHVQRSSRACFAQQGLHGAQQPSLGFLFYALCYSFVMQPACVVGYAKELLNRSKNWGTK